MRGICTCVIGMSLVCVGMAQAGDPALLAKEIELLKREIDLLKRENELLKRENEELKKNASSRPSSGGPAAVPGGDEVARVTVDNVEYVFLGLTRTNTSVIASVLATSKEGNHVGPRGSMVLIDENGEKYTGQLVGGVGTGAALREGVPVKIQWQFGGQNAFTGAAKGSVPPARVTRFAGVMIHRTIGNNGADTIDFRNVPAIGSKSGAVK